MEHLRSLLSDKTILDKSLQHLRDDLLAYIHREMDAYLHRKLAFYGLGLCLLLIFGVVFCYFTYRYLRINEIAREWDLPIKRAERLYRLEPHLPVAKLLRARRESSVFADWCVKRDEILAPYEMSPIG